MNCEIITLIGINLGNRLQNYALQTVLRQMGCNVVTSLIDGPKRPLLRSLKFQYYAYRNRTVHDKFIRFNQRIQWKKDYQSHLHDDPNIDFYIAGSDQIWNPHFKTTTDREFLRFTSEKKRVAYAASIGSAEIPADSIVRYKKYISEIPHVSVREKAGARLIKEITGRDVPVVLDPTLLLGRGDWDDVADDARIKLPERYVLRYFLGGTPTTVDNKIADYCRNNDLREIDAISSIDSLLPSMGPAEFVKAISRAEHVYTDSFHAVCFSIIYRRPFTVFSRMGEIGFGDMTTRFESLFDALSLNNNVITSFKDWTPELDVLSYEQIDAVLGECEKFSKKYLSDALKLN